jgi:hypothetical protein
VPDLFELAAATRDLAAGVQHLDATVQANNHRIDALTRRTERAEQLITRTWVWITLLVILAALLGLVSFKLFQVIEAERDARQRGQCPVLAVFIGAYDPNSRLEGEARDRYDSAFRVIRQAYTDLQCTTPIVPGPGQRAR